MPEVYQPTLRTLRAEEQTVLNRLGKDRTKIITGRRIRVSSTRIRAMPAKDVVTASLRGLEIGEVVCAPGVERAELLQSVFAADLAAFASQSHTLAQRCQPGETID